MIDSATLPIFPYHHNPIESGSIRETNEKCDCCEKSPGVMYDGVIYSIETPENICPWCIASGAAADKYDATFMDATFADENGEEVRLEPKYYDEVFCKTIGFSTYNPIGWWVHCTQPAEFMKRIEPYELLFKCKVCGKEHVVLDYD